MHIYTSVNLLCSSRPKPLPGLTVSRYTVLLLRKICLKCLFYGAFVQVAYNNCRHLRNASNVWQLLVERNFGLKN